MLINKTFEAKCSGCGIKILLYEYEGLVGGLYCDHYCEERSDLLVRNPRAKGFRILREKTK